MGKGQNYCRHRWEKDRITAGTGGKRTELLQAQVVKGQNYCRPGGKRTELLQAQEGKGQNYCRPQVGKEH